MTELKVVKTYEDYPMVLQAKHVREILGLSEAKTYEVLNSKKCPTFTAGKRKLINKDTFFQFLHAMEHESLI